jgi:hypothetical protein
MSILKIKPEYWEKATGFHGMVQNSVLFSNGYSEDIEPHIGDKIYFDVVSEESVKNNELNSKTIILNQPSESFIKSKEMMNVFQYMNEGDAIILIMKDVHPDYSEETWGFFGHLFYNYILQKTFEIPLDVDLFYDHLPTHELKVYCGIKNTNKIKEITENRKKASTMTTQSIVGDVKRIYVQTTEDFPESGYLLINDLKIRYDKRGVNFFENKNGKPLLSTGTSNIIKGTPVKKLRKVFDYSKMPILIKNFDKEISVFVGTRKNLK